MTFIEEFIHRILLICVKLCALLLSSKTFILYSNVTILFNPKEDGEGQKKPRNIYLHNKVTKVKRLIFKLCLPQDITFDLNPHFLHIIFSILCF